jgi:hypothetical protein
VVPHKSKCVIKRMFDNADVKNSLKSTEKK